MCVKEYVRGNIWEGISIYVNAWIYIPRYILVKGWMDGWNDGWMDVCEYGCVWI